MRHFGLEDRGTMQGHERMVGRRFSSLWVATLILFIILVLALVHVV